MRLPLVIGTIVVCCFFTWLLADEGVQVASAANVQALTGGARCYYPNPIQCTNAYDEQDCEGSVWWDDAFYGPYDEGDEFRAGWGYFGTWECPGPDEDIEVNWLSTTIRTRDEDYNGWKTDQEKEDEEDCNTIYFCNCGAEWGPMMGGEPPWCDTYGMPLVSPKGSFREVTGDQDCVPGS